MVVGSEGGGSMLFQAPTISTQSAPTRARQNQSAPRRNP
jgi:hypothetical protein